MQSPWFVTYSEKQHQKLSEQAKKVREKSHAQSVLVIDRNGHFITGAGVSSELDITALSSLAAGNFATVNGLARLMGE